MASSSEGVGNLVDDSFELYVTAAVEALVTQLMNARKRINELDEDLENERTLSGKLGTDAADLRAELCTAKKRNGELEKDLAAELTKSRNLTTKFDALTTQSGEANSLIEKLKTTLAAEQAKSANLTKAVGGLKIQSGKAKTEKKKLTTNLAAERTKSKNLTTENEELKLYVGQLGDDLGNQLEQALRTEANNPKPSIKCYLGHIVVYFLVAIPICYFNYRSFTGMGRGNILTNALYFAVATCLSVGYGDIHPKTTSSKLFTCVLVVYGAHISNHCFIVVQSYIWDKLKAKFLQNVSEPKRTIVIALLTLGAVLISIFGGMWGIYVYENGKNVDDIKEYKLNATDSFYLSMMSLSTEGFGDFSFKTVHGRVFAVFWLLIFQPFYVFALTHLMKLVAMATRHILPGCF